MKLSALSRFGLVALTAAFLVAASPPARAQISADTDSLHAASSLNATATALRTTAVLTTSDVYSTFSLPLDCKAVHFYVNFTKGSLTSADFTPCGAIDGNPASTGYFKQSGGGKNLTASSLIHWRVPREEFGAYRYGGIVTVGTGTATSSDALIYYKLER